MIKAERIRLIVIEILGDDDFKNNDDFDEIGFCSLDKAELIMEIDNGN